MSQPGPAQGRQAARNRVAQRTGFREFRIELPQTRPPDDVEIGKRLPAEWQVRTGTKRISRVVQRTRVQERRTRIIVSSGNRAKAVHIEHECKQTVTSFILEEAAESRQWNGL